eukprot:c17957_g1_i1 orf=105-407(-)
MSNRRNRRSINACLQVLSLKFSWECSFNCQLGENIHITTAVVSYGNCQLEESIHVTTGKAWVYEIRIRSSNIICTLCSENFGVPGTLMANAAFYLPMVAV